MKTRAEIYGNEAADLLRIVTMYPGLCEHQLLCFHPGKEDTAKALLSHLERQGRIFQTDGGGYFLAGQTPKTDHALVRGGIQHGQDPALNTCILRSRPIRLFPAKILILPIRGRVKFCPCRLNLLDRHRLRGKKDRVCRGIIAALLVRDIDLVAVLCMTHDQHIAGSIPKLARAIEAFAPTRTWIFVGMGHQQDRKPVLLRLHPQQLKQIPDLLTIV